MILLWLYLAITWLTGVGIAISFYESDKKKEVALPSSAKIFVFVLAMPIVLPIAIGMALADEISIR